MTRLEQKIRSYWYTQKLMRSQYWPRKKLDIYVQKKLARTVADAALVPFWHDQFASIDLNPNVYSQKDFERLPIVSKQDFRRHEVAQYTNAHLLPQSYAEETSGSTGEPFRFYHDLRYEALCVAVRERMYRTLAGKRYPIFFIRPMERRAFAFSRYESFFIRSNNSLSERFPALVERIQHYPDGVILYCLCSWLLKLAEVYQMSGQTLQIRGIFPVGEILTPEQREMLAKTFATKVCLPTYGMVEVGNIALRCEYDRNHVSEEWVYVEIVDEHGHPLPLGSEGRILVTSFENRAMPLIRYNTGDIGVISPDACPCGRTLHTIELLGRQMHVLKLPDNRSISVMHLTGILDSIPGAIDKYQIIWHGGYTFTIAVIPGQSFADAQRTLTQMLQGIVHPSATVEWQVVNTIPHRPNGKAIYFVDNSK